MKIKFLLVSLLATSLHVFSQQDEDLSYYFDDGGISTGLLLKTDILSSLRGDVPLIIEKKLGPQLTIEGGVGLILPYYIPDLPSMAFVDISNELQNNRFGSSIRLQLKFYNDAPENRYWGLRYHRRNYYEVKVNDLVFTSGLQRIIGQRLLIDIALGLGIRTQNSRGNQYVFDQDSGILPILPLMIKFGFITTN
jgi:hypothetical protein